MAAWVRHWIMAGVWLAGCASAAQAGNPTANVLDVDCNRACLTAALEQVLSAIAAKDISALPLGNDVRSTQNGVEIRLDDGLWQTVSAIGKYRLYAIDPVSGQAGVFTTMTQGKKQLLVALRIGTWEQKIQEIEFVSSAGGGGPGGIGAMTPGDRAEQAGTPRPQFLRTVPVKERMSRPDLVKVSNSYFSWLQGSTGKGASPFAPTCHRLENMFATTNNKTSPSSNSNGVNMIAMGCEEQQKLGYFQFVTSIRDRRFPIIDEERGLVMAFGYFDHSGTVTELKLTDGRTLPGNLRNPATWMISEVFQMDKGKIDQVEAVLDAVPYKTRNAIWKDGDRLP